MVQDDSNFTDKDIEDKIMHLLAIYPVISPTMLQGGLGPYIKPRRWRALLEKLKKAGMVVESKESKETTTSRYNTYVKLHLPHIQVTLDGDVIFDADASDDAS